MIGGMHRIVLFCRDTEASKAWYEQVGFEYKHGHGGMYWFAWGDGEIMLHPAHPMEESDKHAGQAPTAAADFPPDNTPAFHAAVRDLDGLFKHVKEKGLTPWDYGAPKPLVEPVVRPWGEREFELVDPDGHRWAFTEVLEPENS